MSGVNSSNWGGNGSNWLSSVSISIWTSCNVGSSYWGSSGVSISSRISVSCSRDNCSTSGGQAGKDGNLQFLKSK